MGHLGVLGMLVGGQDRHLDGCENLILSQGRLERTKKEIVGRHGSRTAAHDAASALDGELGVHYL